MKTAEKKLLCAVGAYLEWKVRPDGFVREPLYNLANSYLEYLKSLEELPFPTALETFELYFRERLEELKAEMVADQRHEVAAD